jgi:hypothetical protein
MIKTDCLLLNSDSQTIAGVWLDSAPYIRIEKDATPELIIEKLFEVLNSSRIGIPHPTDWSGITKAYVHSMGYKSLKQLYKDAKNCSICCENGNLEFLPTVNDGRGFAHKPGLIITIKSSEPIPKIYAALMEAIDKCE